MIVTAEPSPDWRGLGNRYAGLRARSWEVSPADLGLGSDAGGGVGGPELTIRLTNDACRVPTVPERLTVGVLRAIFAAEARRTPALDSAAEAGFAGGLEACATAAEAARDRHTV